MAGMMGWQPEDSVEGFLEGPSGEILDRISALLTGLGPSKLLSQKESSILAQTLQLFVKLANQPLSAQQGSWAFQLDSAGPGGKSLLLRSPSAKWHVQLDRKGRPHGLLMVVIQGREWALDMDCSADGWRLRRWDGPESVDYPLSLPPGQDLPWAGAPSMDLLGQLLPGLGGFLGGWLSASAEAPRSSNPKPPSQPIHVEPPLATSQLPGRLRVLSGPMKGREFPLGPVCRLGRSDDNEIPLEDFSASRHHAVIEQGAEGYSIRDLGSANGVQVNGQRIQGPCLLKAGDRIRLGVTPLEVLPRTSPAEDPVPTPTVAQVMSYAREIPTLHCPACHALVPTGSHYCQACGGALPRPCPHCGAVSHGSRFCTECGKGLNG